LATSYSSIARIVSVQSHSFYSNDADTLAGNLQLEGVIERSPSLGDTGSRQETGIRAGKRRRSATIVLSSDDEEEDVTIVGAKRIKTTDEDVIDLTDD
jgi:hypothetical protein